MTDFFHTLKDKATGKLYSVLDVNAAKKDLSNIGTVNVSVFTNDAGYLTAIPNTYKTKAENDGLYQAKGSYLTAVPSAYKTKTENDALYQAKGSYLTAIPNTVALKTDISSFKAPSSIDLEDLKNVSGTANTNDYLQWTGSTWEGKPLNLSAYALKANYYTKSESYTAGEIDTKIAGYEIKGTAYSKADSDGKYALKTAIANFKAPNDISIDDLNDVTVSSVKNGQSLVWQNNKWVNNDVVGGTNLVTINAEWSDTAGDTIPASIAALKAGALIRFNGNILEILKDGTRLVKAPDLAPNDYSMIAPAKHDQWSGSYTKYIRGEIVFHNNAWWQCKQVVNVGDEPGTSLGAFKWEKYEGIGNHEDYLRLDGDKLWTNSGHQVAEYGKNVISYDSGKLYQGNGTEIGAVVTTSDLTTALSSYATSSNLTAGLATKENAVPSGSYNVYHDTTNHYLTDTNSNVLTGSGANQIPHSDAQLAVKAKRAVFDGKDNVVYDGTNYISQDIASDGTITDTTLDLATNAQVDAKIKSAASKVAITYDSGNEEIKVKFS